MLKKCPLHTYRAFYKGCLCCISALLYEWTVLDYCQLYHFKELIFFCWKVNHVLCAYELWILCSTYTSVHIIFKFPDMFLFWFLADISNSLMSLNMVFLSYWKEICLYYTCIRNDFQIGKRLIWCCGKSQNKKNSLVPLFVDDHQPTTESWHF